MNENKTNINWLACIYGEHQLNPYIMLVCEKWDLTSFNKNKKNDLKKQVKIYSFLRGIVVLVCDIPTYYV